VCCCCHQATHAADLALQQCTSLRTKVQVQKHAGVVWCSVVTSASAAFAAAVACELRFVLLLLLLPLLLLLLQNDYDLTFLTDWELLNECCSEAAVYKIIDSDCRNIPAKPGSDASDDPPLPPDESQAGIVEVGRQSRLWGKVQVHNTVQQPGVYSVARQCERRVIKGRALCVGFRVVDLRDALGYLCVVTLWPGTVCPTNFCVQLFPLPHLHPCSPPHPLPARPCLCAVCRNATLRTMTLLTVKCSRCGRSAVTVWPCRPRGTWTVRSHNGADI
jgi:hypothetical protein